MFSDFRSAYIGTPPYLTPIGKTFYSVLDPNAFAMRYRSGSCHPLETRDRPLPVDIPRHVLREIREGIPQPGGFLAVPLQTRYYTGS